MTLVSIIRFLSMPDIMVWPEIILVIALVSKIRDGLHLCKVQLYKLPSFSTERTEKHNLQNNTNLLFHLAQIAAILDFKNNPMFKVLSDYITMSGITKTLMLQIKIKNLHLFCQKYYHFIVSSCTNGGHITLDVDNNCRRLK